MSVEEIKRNELWEKLERNQAFIFEFKRIWKKMQRYRDKDTSKIEIKDGKLVITTITGVCQRDSKTQCRKVKIYEFSIDTDNKLLLYKKKGTIITCRGKEYWTSSSGKIENKCSCILYDGDGVVLSYQKYTDHKVLKGNVLDTYRLKSIQLVDEAHDPHLPYTIDEKLKAWAPSVVGSRKNKYLKLFRKDDELEIVHRIACSFKQDSEIIDYSHELFFSTLSSDDIVNYNPNHINIDEDEEAFATVDSNGEVHINEDALAEGITEEDYKETARERFLDELREDRDAIPVAPDTDRVEEMYDLMISKLEKEPEKDK